MFWKKGMNIQYPSFVASFRYSEDDTMISSFSLADQRKDTVLAEIRCHGKWQRMRCRVHKYENLLNREFHKPSSFFLT